MTSHNGNRKTQTMRVGGGDAETLASLERQHEVVDTQVRSTDGIDYGRVRREAIELIEKRKTGMNSSQLKALATKDFPYFSTKFPQFTQAIVKDCESRRLDEFTKIMNSLLDGLEKVQSGRMTQTELRKTLFETELANRYLRPK